MQNSEKKAQERILDYLLNEMSLQEKEIFEKEISTLPELQALLEENRNLLKNLEFEASQDFRRDLTQDILSKISLSCGSEKKKGSIWKSFNKTFALVAGFLLCFGAWGIFRKVYFRDGFEEKTLNNRKLAKDSFLEGGNEEDFSAAVTAARLWLIRSQDNSGAWPAEKWGGQAHFTVGLTSLSLMVLAKSSLPSAREALFLGKGYLLSQQDHRGLFGPLVPGALYNHALALLFLLETGNRENSETFQKAVVKALALLCQTQSPSGAWGYLNVPESENSSLTLWQLAVLEKVDLLNWPKVKDLHLDRVKARAMVWLRSVMDEKGRVGYQRQDDFPHGYRALTAMAQVFLSRLENTQQRSFVDVNLREIDFKDQDFYRDFFLTKLAKKQQRNYLPLLRHIQKKQVKGGLERGSWLPDDSWSSAGGRVYATALAALSLQAN
jgi:hypothetical protein